MSLEISFVFHCVLDSPIFGHKVLGVSDFFFFGQGF